MKAIAFDFDDVIANFNQGYVDFHNRTYGVPIMSFEDIVDFDMTKLYDVDYATIIARVMKFCHEHHDDIAPWSGVDTSLERLAQKYEIHIITSRCETLQTVTENWLVTHGLRDHFTELHFTNSFGSKFPDRKRTKLSVCQELDVVALVEDAPAHALDVAKAGIPVCMPHRPWNKNVFHNRLQRIKSMDAIPF